VSRRKDYLLARPFPPDRVRTVQLLDERGLDAIAGLKAAVGAAAWRPPAGLGGIPAHRRASPLEVIV